MKKFAFLSALTVLVASTASAHLIDQGIYNLDSAIGNPDAEAAWLETQFSLGSDYLTFLFKEQEDDGELIQEGPLAETGKVVVTGITSAFGTAAWDLTGTGFLLKYVLVKDGRDGGLFPYHIYSVSEDQMLTNELIGEAITVNGSKAISHVSFFGIAGDVSVPDTGATVALLGLGLAGLIGFRRFRR